jgi:hypothetical protein
LFNIEITPDNNEQASIFRCFHLMINIRKMAVYEKPEMVTISGAIIMPENMFWPA